MSTTAQLGRTDQADKLDVDAGDRRRASATVLPSRWSAASAHPRQRPAPGLLSSLQGAAVTSVQIDGVLHEFSSIAGVREDVTDIVLNLKAMALRMDVEGPKRITLDAQGPGSCTAGMIREPAHRDHGPGSRDLHLDEGAMSHGTDGREPARAMSPPTEPPGRCADRPDPDRRDLLAGRKVSYESRTTRDGQVLDYDKLTLKSKPMARHARRMRWPMPRASCRTSCSSSSTSTSRKARVASRRRRTGVQPAAAEEGGRAGTVGPLGQLPEERQHRLYRRSDPEDREPRCCAPRTSAASR